MDKGKNNDAFKAEVNETAERFYNYKINENKSGCTNESKKLFSLLYFYAQRNYKIDEMYRERYIDVAIEVFDYCIKKWTPENRGFYQFYMHILNKRSKKIYKESIPSPVDLDNNENFKQFESGDNTEKETFQQDAVQNLFIILNRAILTDKKKWENKSKICYSKYFYTEFVTEQIQKIDQPIVFHKAEDELMKIIEHDFISYYMDGENQTVSQINRGTLKKLSEFTSKMEDNKPCGYPINQKYVYLSFLLKKYGTEQNPCEETISTKKTKFKKLIKETALKNFYD